MVWFRVLIPFVTARRRVTVCYYGSGHMLFVPVVEVFGCPLLHVHCNTGTDLARALTSDPTFDVDMKLIWLERTLWQKNGGRPLHASFDLTGRLVPNGGFLCEQFLIGPATSVFDFVVTDLPDDPKFSRSNGWRVYGDWLLLFVVAVCVACVRGLRFDG